MLLWVLFFADMLMDPNYGDLRRAIFANSAELSYFRQLVINGKLRSKYFLTCLAEYWHSTTNSNASIHSSSCPGDRYF